MELPWEDSLLERKTENDLKDLLKTMVAFANSVRPGHVAVILIGERDDGTIQGVSNPDVIQKKVRENAERIYPPILWRSAVYEEGGLPCVRIEIEHDGDTPHFGGNAWVRKGSVTISASDEMFQKLIELRVDKLRELSKWIGKEVSVTVDNSSVNWGNPHGSDFGNAWGLFWTSTLVEVNKYWITVESKQGEKRSVSTQKIFLEFDDNNYRLRIVVVFSGNVPY